VLTSFPVASPLAPSVCLPSLCPSPLPTDVNDKIDHEDGDNHIETKKNAHPRSDDNYCGQCYGAETTTGQCCNTCEEVRAAYREKGWALENLSKIEQCVDAGETNEAFATAMERGDGCRMFGYVNVNKVRGNFHFAPGKPFAHSQMHIHDLVSFDATAFNISHEIHSLSFGRSYPGAKAPLNGAKETVTTGGGMYMYHMKVVPTTYMYSSGAAISTNSYSVTKHHRKDQPAPVHGYGLPGVFFFYQLSPIRVQHFEESRSLLHLITQICGIVAGVYTVAGMFDKLVYKGVRQVEKKMNLGKQS
jgi:endoplasmic reticulum-Golgi intermediate compartment protein 3